MKFTKEMKIADVLKKHASGKAVFEKFLPGCITCGGASAESIERGARMHGVDPDLIVEELNRTAKGRRKSDG
jgi:hybrid cluster-associated redox disulfide protein